MATKVPTMGQVKSGLSSTVIPGIVGGIGAAVGNAVAGPLGAMALAYLAGMTQDDTAAKIIGINAVMDGTFAALSS